MMIFTSTSFKPRKKSKVKPKGVIAKKLNVSSIRTANKLPTYSHVPRVGAEQANSISSLASAFSSTEKRESVKYTGTLIKGIATMHKSNAVPVIDEEQMKDISRMRRG